MNEPLNEPDLADINEASNPIEPSTSSTFDSNMNEQNSNENNQEALANQQENQVEFCPTATPQQLDYLNQFNGICIIPNTALTQTECSNDTCFNALNKDYKWYNPSTQKFTCQECAVVQKKLYNFIFKSNRYLKCFVKLNDPCPVCLGRIRDFALLPCGHGRLILTARYKSILFSCSVGCKI